MRHQLHTEHVFAGLADLNIACANLHATSLPAASGMNLGLDDPAFATHFARPVSCLLRAVSERSFGNGNAETSKNLFGLIFVYIHSRILSGALFCSDRGAVVLSQDRIHARLIDTAAQVADCLRKAGYDISNCSLAEKVEDADAYLYGR